MLLLKLLTTCDYSYAMYPSVFGAALHWRGSVLVILICLANST